MSPPRCILVGYNFSPDGDLVLQASRILAERSEAALYLVHAVEPSPLFEQRSLLRQLGVSACFMYTGKSYRSSLEKNSVLWPRPVNRPAYHQRGHDIRRYCPVGALTVAFTQQHTPLLVGPQARDGRGVDGLDGPLFLAPAHQLDRHARAAPGEGPIDQRDQRDLAAFHSPLNPMPAPAQLEDVGQRGTGEASLRVDQLPGQHRDQYEAKQVGGARGRRLNHAVDRPRCQIYWLDWTARAWDEWDSLDTHLAFQISGRLAYLFGTTRGKGTNMKKILITGATGQIGSELTPALRNKYGAENVIAAGHTRTPPADMVKAGPYCQVDVREMATLQATVREHQIDTIYHLAAVLSAEAETSPQLAWDINMKGLLNVLETARLYHCAVFFPSSIGAFGPLTPQENTPQDTIQHPTTMYGITKVSGELLCDYYQQRFGVDTRGVRYPGLISHTTVPHGGTTDYAVHIFYAALRDKRYACFLKAGTRLDMMDMPDAIKAAIDVMEAESTQLLHRNGYNITAMSFAPEELAAAIMHRMPDFVRRYEIDPVRQAIAESWPRHMDDSAARQEWGWRPDYDLEAMVDDMLEKLSQKTNLMR